MIRHKVLYFPIHSVFPHVSARCCHRFTHTSRIKQLQDESHAAVQKRMQPGDKLPSSSENIAPPSPAALDAGVTAPLHHHACDSNAETPWGSPAGRRHCDQVIQATSHHCRCCCWSYPPPSGPKHQSMTSMHCPGSLMTTCWIPCAADKGSQWAAIVVRGMGMGESLVGLSTSCLIGIACLFSVV